MKKKEEWWWWWRRRRGKKRNEKNSSLPVGCLPIILFITWWIDRYPQIISRHSKKIRLLLMFNAPVVDNDDEEEERDVRFNFGIKKKERNPHALALVWTRQNDYSNDNGLFVRRTSKCRKGLITISYLADWQRIMIAGQRRLASRPNIKADTTVRPNHSSISSSSFSIFLSIWHASNANLWCNDQQCGWCTHRKGRFTR